MRRHWWLTLILSGLIVSLALGANDKEDLARNQRLLERWRADPDHYQRLLRDQRAFYALPRSRQEQIRILDRQLHDTDPVTQTRLWSVLERYNSWLETLTEEQRRQIARAPDPTTRLALIRDMRLREWLYRLPKQQQNEVAGLPPDQQPERIAALRSEERQQREKWMRDWIRSEAAIPRPARLSELPPETQAFVQEHLISKRLTDNESKRLKNLEGKYPEWLRYLYNLAETHPVLPPLPSGAIVNLKDLPSGVIQKLRPGADKGKKGKGLSRNRDKWPQFALDVQRIAEEKKVKIPPLGASRAADFSDEIQAFLKLKMFPALNKTQKEELTRAEGQWPRYPKLLLKFARDRRMIIPGMSIPGRFDMWDSARVQASLPDVPNHLLFQFINELPVKDRAALGLAKNDPVGNLEKMKKAYYAHQKAEADRKRKDR